MFSPRVRSASRHAHGAGGLSESADGNISLRHTTLLQWRFGGDIPVQPEGLAESLSRPIVDASNHDSSPRNVAIVGKKRGTEAAHAV